MSRPRGSWRALRAGGEADAAAVLDAARTRMFRGRLSAAEDLLAGALRERPRDAQARFLLGMLRRFQGRLAASIAELRAARALSPRKARSHLYLAEALMKARRVSESLKVLREGLRRSAPPGPRDEQALLERYRLLLCSLDFARAAELGERLLVLAPPAPGDMPRAAWPVFHEDFELYRRPAAYLDAMWAALGRTKPSLWRAYFRVRLFGMKRPRALEAVLREDCAQLLAASGPHAWMRTAAEELRWLRNP